MYFFIVALDAGATSSASEPLQEIEGASASARAMYVSTIQPQHAHEGQYIGRYIGGMECD